VVDLVHAGLDALNCGHAIGNVAGDGHAVVMGALGDDGDEGGRDGAVDFHLQRTGGVIAVNDSDGFSGRGGGDGADGVRAGAVHDSGHVDVGTDAAAAVDGIFDGGDEVELVAAVADVGDSGGEIDGTPLDLLVVGVHVPQAGEDEFAGGVEDGGILRNLDFVARAGSDDGVASGEDDGVGDGRGSGAVDESAAGDGEEFHFRLAG